MTEEREPSLIPPPGFPVLLINEKKKKIQEI
jgi:hypothetical protein